MAKIITLDKVQDEIFHLQKYGQHRGLLVGFSNLDKLYSIKAGTTTIIYGYPTSGKSQLLIQMLCSLACQGKKSLIMTPETGTAAEIYAEIIHCLTGKTFRQTQNYTITEMELYNIIPFVKDYFKVVDVDEKSATVDEFCELTKEGIKDHSIFTSSFDNWNDLQHVFENREDLYIEASIPQFNRLARKEQIHIFGVWHAKSPSLQSGDKFPKAPSPFDIKGGSAIFSKAMNLIGVHRDYEEHAEGWRQSDQVNIITSKIKPKVVGEKGSCKLRFDIYRNAYYEDKGERFYLSTPFNSGAVNQPEQPKPEPKQKKEFIQTTANLIDNSDIDPYKDVPFNPAPF